MPWLYGLLGWPQPRQQLRVSTAEITALPFFDTFVANFINSLCRPYIPCADSFPAHPQRAQQMVSHCGTRGDLFLGILNNRISHISFRLYFYLQIYNQ